MQWIIIVGCIVLLILITALSGASDKGDSNFHGGGGGF